MNKIAFEFDEPGEYAPRDGYEKVERENIAAIIKYQDKYFILFSESAIKNKRFIKTYVMMSEFCSRYYAYDMHYATISEKGSLIIANRALHKLSRI